jgi:hypothetical protein
MMAARAAKTANSKRRKAGRRKPPIIKWDSEARAAGTMQVLSQKTIQRFMQASRASPAMR